MAETQLQLGPIEELPPDTQPTAKDVVMPAPDSPITGEEKGGIDELPPMLEPVFSPEELALAGDAFGGIPDMFMPDGTGGSAPLTIPQMEGVAETLEKLSQSRFSVEDIRKAFNEGVFGTSVDEAMAALLETKGELRKQAMMQTLNRGDLTVPQRLEIVRAIDESMRGPDMNAVAREELRRANEEENGGYTDEQQDAYAAALDTIVGVPTLARVDSKPLTKEEMQRSFTELLNLYASDADKRSGVLNFLPNLLPFFGTTAIVKVLKELNAATGADIGISTVGGAFLPGTAIRAMRERIEEMPLEEKVKTFGKVMQVLRGNRAIFPTQNAHIQSYLIQSMFYKDMTGQEFIKQATDQENKRYLAARETADQFARKAMHEQDPDKAKEYARQRNQWEEKARDIKQNASGRMWHEYDKVTFSQWLDDMAIIDFALIMPLARGTIKLGQKGGLVGSTAALKVAPDKTTKQFVRMLQDPRVRKRYSDLLGEDIAETMLPAAIKGAEEAGIEGMGEMLERSIRINQEIKQTLYEGSNITAQTQRAYVDELKQIFGNFTSKDRMHRTKSVFEIAPEGVNVTARYGASPTKAFGTFQAARKALDELPIEGRIVELTDDGFVPATQSDRISQYFVEVADSRTYDSSRTAWEQMLFPREQVRAPWFLPVNSLIKGNAAKLWNWPLSSSDMFGPEIFNKITSDVMRASAVQKLHTGFVRTMLSLPRKEQALVSSLLKQGEEIPTLNGRGTVFTVEQIKKMHPYATDGVIKGYYEARLLSDNMWELANTQKRAEFFRENVKAIESSTGHVGFGRVLPTADDAVADIKSAQGYKTLHVFDPETGKFSALRRSEIDQLYADGHTLARMEDLVQGKGFAEATHVIVDRVKGKVKELPRNVLERTGGYYPHIYQANYIVYGVSKAGNRVAIATARSAADAAREKVKMMRVMQRMGSKAPFETVDYRFDRSLRDPLTYTRDVDGPIYGAQQIIYGARGTGTSKLRNASEKYGENMIDPIEALLRGSELVTHSVTKGALIRNMESRLYNTLRLMEKEYGTRIIKDPTKLVKTVDDIEYPSVASKDLKRAVAYMHQIDMVRHIPDSVETTMSNLASWSSTIFDQVAAKVGRETKIGKAIEFVEEKLASAATQPTDPMRFLTEIAHRVYIAGNPIQQFALQLGQASLLLGISPRDMPLAISRAVPMQTLVNTRIMMNSGEAGYHEAYKRLLPIAAKAMGMSEKNADKMVGVLERSGLVDTVSVHSQIRTATRAQAMSRMLSTASGINNPTIMRNAIDGLRRIDEATFGKLSQLGFENGEQMNRIISFMTMYSRDARKGIASLDNPTYIQKLVGEVNTIVGSMLRETSMGYQRGWLKAAFQFVAFQHKMATMMLFSKNLTLKQKTFVGLSQFLLFGSRGAAHIDAFHRLMDKMMNDYEAKNDGEKNEIMALYHDERTQSALDGIVFDMGVNAVMRAIGGEDTPGFAWNRRLAPGGGSDMLIDAVMELRNNPTERIFGLSGKHGSKVWKFFDKTRRYMLASAKDMDDAMTPEERFKLLGKEGLTLAFSGYNKYLQASVMKSMGGPVSETGNIGMSSGTYLERVLAAGLGVTTEDRQAFLDATDKYYYDVRNTPKRHKEALDEIADQLYREMVTEMVHLRGEAATPEVYEDMQTRLLQNKAMLLSFLTPHEAEVVSESIGNKIAEAIKNKQKGTTAEQAFIDDLTKDLREGKLGDEESLEWATYLGNTPLMKNHPEMMGPFLEARRQMATYEDEEE